MTKQRLHELSGVSLNAISSASRGAYVSEITARKLCAALGLELTHVFTLEDNAGKLSARTVWHHHKLIRAILAEAKKTRIIPHNVVQEYMYAPKLPRTEARYLNDTETRTFFAALMDEEDIRAKTALTLDLFTGLRRGELCGLSWPDINFDNNVIRLTNASQYVAGHGVIEVPTKNKSSARNITVSPFVMALLSNYRKWWCEYRIKMGDAWTGDGDRLFVQWDGKPLFPATINLWLKRVVERNHLPHISPHALRHTFITLQITEGVDLRTVQARSGHAQASTLLNLYGHAVQSAQERAAQAMDDVLLRKWT